MEHYIKKDGKILRYGYTTGSCAALAAKAATQMLFCQKNVANSSIVTPNGVTVEAAVHEISFGEKQAQCAIRKDAGDDPDLTDGILVYATVSFSPQAGITIDGGEGVGRITRDGLDQQIGAAAINRVPREMIAKEVTGVCQENHYTCGIEVVISIPEGGTIAEKTFNPHLGIVGGLSVIGTTGIVEPMSNQAILDTIDIELKMHKAEDARDLIIVLGNYGEQFLRENRSIAIRPTVTCSNFIGDTLDMVRYHEFRSVLLVGHIGKLVKLAGGIMDTHSKIADARMELFALHAALAGGDIGLMQSILSCVTTEEALLLLQEVGLKDSVVMSLLYTSDSYLARRAKKEFAVGLVMFSQKQGLLGISPAGKTIWEGWRKDDE